MINSLTSLRFIFAMMVFGAHCYIIDDFFNAHFFKEGFAGVSFFFVLSGFIISYNYQYKLQEHKTDKRTFWAARICIPATLADTFYSRHPGRQLCHRVRRLRLGRTLPDFINPHKCVYTQGGFLLLIQQSLMEPVLRTAILFLLPVSHAAGHKAQTPASCIPRNGYNRYHRNVSDSTGSYQRILVRQSGHPLPRLHCWHAAVSAV